MNNVINLNQEREINELIDKLGSLMANDETMTDGLKYVACVIKTLSKGGKPWNMFIKMPEPTIISNLQKMIKQILLRNENIKQLIEKKRFIYSRQKIYIFNH